MATSSRSSLRFNARMGLKKEQFAPRQKMDVAAFKINSVPVQPVVEQPFLLAQDGPNPPDRGDTRSWPPPQ